ncbi:MAG TPA: hypothetical protein VE967_19605 [Gemmatimonadaceae bacterium]|nr:hypothetical protein [Gemmatimonadaceae bacterium]
MSFEDTPAGYAVCQACDAPATHTVKYEGKETVLCKYHRELLGKHASFAEALQERARKEKKR